MTDIMPPAATMMDVDAPQSPVRANKEDLETEEQVMATDVVSSPVQHTLESVSDNLTSPQTPATMSKKSKASTPQGGAGLEKRIIEAITTLAAVSHH